MTDEGRERGPAGEEEKYLTLANNPAFRRFAGSFELYQKLLASEPNVAEIKGRMEDMYLSRFAEPIDAPMPDQEKAKLILEGALQKCEANKFSTVGFAEDFVTSMVADEVMQMWDPERDATEKDPGAINSIVHYSVEGPKVISVHLGTSGVSSEEFFKLTAEGLMALAKKIKQGEIEAEMITMKSWLLGRRNEAKVRALLGDDIEIIDVSPDDEEVKSIQQTALEQNNKSFEQYLKTGVRPEVRQLEIAGDEFVKKLLG